MDNKEIFKRIVSIVENDYSGFVDKFEWADPFEFEVQIKSDMTRNEFRDVLNNYLGKFKDGHLRIVDLSQDDTYCGFSIRRYENILVVTEANPESGYKKGDIIHEVDGKSIIELESVYCHLFFSDVTDRQDWSIILKKHRTCRLVRDGKSLTREIKRFPKSKYSPRFYVDVVHGIPKMTITDFVDSASLKQLIDKYIAIRTNDEALIIDVRYNIGGADFSYFPLLDFIFKDKKSFVSLFPNEKQQMLYSKRNCELMTLMLNEYSQNTSDPVIQDLIQKDLHLMKENFGKGYVDYEGLSDDFNFEGNEIPKRIYVLIDQYCASSGENFARAVRHSEKVTLIGRNTAGILDYSNVITESITDDLNIIYPTTRLIKGNKVLGIDNIGVSPDIYVPWTPKALEIDIDLNKVVQLEKNIEKETVDRTSVVSSHL